MGSLLCVHNRKLFTWNQIDIYIFVYIKSNRNNECLRGLFEKKQQNFLAFFALTIYIYMYIYTQKQLKTYEGETKGRARKQREKKQINKCS